jgi:hypothetical protein
VHFLDDMGSAIQQQNHLAFELGWQNCFHICRLRHVRRSLLRSLSRGETLRDPHPPEYFGGYEALA